MTLENIIIYIVDELMLNENNINICDKRRRFHFILNISIILPCSMSTENAIMYDHEVSVRY